MTVFSKAWIFVSHSTKDIRKVRLIRNYLERASAEPLLFRLKYLDDRPRSIPTLLQAEMRARQFFLLCDSVNARNSHWVGEEIAYIDPLPNKHKYIIDLDAHRTVPKRELAAFLRHAFAVVSYSWADRRRIKALVKTITRDGVGGRVDAEDDITAPLESYKEPLTIDHGLLGLDDRAQPRGRPWVDTARALSERADTFIHCGTRSDQTDRLAIGRFGEIIDAGSAFKHRYLLDLDGFRGDPLDTYPFSPDGWVVLRGPVQDQLRELVQSMREQVGPEAAKRDREQTD